MSTRNNGALRRFYRLPIMSLTECLSVFVKFFFILTPFFIVAVFIAMTENETVPVRHALAVRVTVGVVVISLILFFLPVRPFLSFWASRSMPFASRPGRCSFVGRLPRAR